MNISNADENSQYVNKHSNSPGVGSLGDDVIVDLFRCSVTYAAIVVCNLLTLHLQSGQAETEQLEFVSRHTDVAWLKQYIKTFSNNLTERMRCFLPHLSALTSLFYGITRFAISPVFKQKQAIMMLCRKLEKFCFII